MNDDFSTLDITRALGVAPSTGSIIAALLNGHLHPQRYRALQQWPLLDMGAPVPVGQTLCAICDLMGLEVEAITVLSVGDGEEVAAYIDHGMDDQPTVMWDFGGRRYLICPLEEMINTLD